MAGALLQIPREIAPFCGGPLPVRYGLESTKNPKAELVFSCPREFWGDFQKWRGFRCGACAAERDDHGGWTLNSKLVGREVSLYFAKMRSARDWAACRTEATYATEGETGEQLFA